MYCYISIELTLRMVGSNFTFLHYNFEKSGGSTVPSDPPVTPSLRGSKTQVKKEMFQKWHIITELKRKIFVRKVYNKCLVYKKTRLIFFQKRFAKLNALTYSIFWLIQDRDRGAGGPRGCSGVSWPGDFRFRSPPTRCCWRTTSSWRRRLT